MKEILLDTSAWLDLLLRRKPIPAGELAGNRLVASPLSLAEVASLAGRKRIPADVAARILAVARLEEASLEDMLEGGRLHARLRNRGNSKVSLVDCILYSCARRGSMRFLTSDGDLAGQPGVKVL